MRKNLSLYFLLMIVTIASCRKYDDVFDKSPDTRINETLAAYNDALTGAPYGWKALVYPSGLPNTAFGFYFKFDTTNRVDMFSDFDSLSSVTVRQSSFRLKSLQQPCLLFDTYSYIHVLCDPDASKNQGYYGKGLFSDFEFSIDGIYGDTIKLTGRLNGSKAILVKATSKEAQDYYDKKRNWEFNNISRFLTYFKQMAVGNNKYDVYVDKLYRQINFVRPDGNEVRTITVNYIFDGNGIAFETPFRDGALTFSSFTDIRWDASAQKMTVKAGENTAVITGVIKPMVVDVTAGQRWYNQAASTGSYWVSTTGFHINGIDDAYNVAGIAGFRFMFYYPNYGEGYDFAGIVPEGYAYGPAFKPTFRSNGTTTFTYPDGGWGEIPDAAAATMSLIVTKYQESEGFYFVQTGNSSYDMVNVKDARSWISWQQ
ncbi:DUF4302 domain-containing protein [Chitinophaga ginsengisoli]|uniref:Uncharacterized protein DUF4302 n=1 Tax=Chitinophaga ginsengisoli TaxID=363837 RepID=A0A2P8G9M8_9BACT|nr:DUF4302 domain-containing protein [Chitinophaga ginsengisoli]PSL30673.1 uncharacterized protein DUF4302 [Chitinophaga ginsengisoli]